MGRALVCTLRARLIQAEAKRLAASNNGGETLSAATPPGIFEAA
jgi:hypothetical protein